MAIFGEVVHWLLDVLGALPPPLVVFVLAMLPVAELRASIPVGLLVYKMPMLDVLVLSIIGNILPVPFIFWFLRPMERLLRKVPLFDRIIDKVFARTRSKSIEHIERYEELALVVLVAIPLPGTGAWTGTLAAYLFDLPRRKSFFFIFLGVLGAAAIVTTLILIFEVGASSFL